MAKFPIFLIHEPMQHFFDRKYEPTPWTTLLTQQRRIQSALSIRRKRHLFEAMTNDALDVYTFVLHLWIDDLTIPSDVMDQVADA